MKPRSSSPEDFESCRKGHAGPGRFGAFAGDVSARLQLLRRNGAGGGGSGGASGSGSGSGSGARPPLFSFPLLAVFCVGVALGIVASERLYLAGALSVAAAARSGHPTAATTAAATAAAATAASTALLPPPSPSSCACAAAAAAANSNHSSWLTPLPARERRELADLEAYLAKIAPTREVLVALSDASPLREGMLDTFLKGVADVAGVTNYVIVALDRETELALQSRGRNAFYMPAAIPASQRDAGANHAISALKFGVLRKFLALGWSVLLSDVDVAVLSNPFLSAAAAAQGGGGGGLWRDSDVEGMSDGFDGPTAYGAIDGYEDVSMGWSRYAQLHKRFNLNSGLFFARSNDRTVELMRRLEARLSREKYWDQTAYNEELFFLSHGSEYRSPQATVRVMDIYKFMNSKVLFKDVRHRAVADMPSGGKPCMVHINYHPDKHARMRAVFAYYADGDARALDGFPGGSEPGT